MRQSAATSQRGFDPSRVSPQPSRGPSGSSPTPSGVPSGVGSRPVGSLSAEPQDLSTLLGQVKPVMPALLTVVLVLCTSQAVYWFLVCIA